MKADLFAFWFVVGVFVTVHVLVTGRVMWWLLAVAAFATLVVIGREERDA